MTSCRNVAFAMLAVVLLTDASAADRSFDPATRIAIQSVITKQLDAIAHEDAAAAESFASPGIREKFPEPAKFFEMVKQNYAALVKPKSTQFGPTENSPHGPLQTVTVVAADGTVWTAIYSFQQIDGDWRISGCGIERDRQQQDI